MENQKQRSRQSHGSSSSHAASRAVLGLKLRALRKEKGLFQQDIGDVLGIPQRIVSSIERGDRNLTPPQLGKLKTKYGIDLVNVEIGPSQAVNALLSESEFFDLQEEFLLAQSQRSYDLWLLNPESLPLLESNNVVGTWAANLREGIDYHTLWIFDLATPEDLQRFVARIWDVLVQAVGSNSKSWSGGKIHLHPLTVCFRNSEGPAELLSYYKALIDERKKDLCVEAALFLHEPLVLHRDDSTGALFELLLRFYFDSGSVVAYRPRSPLYAKPLLAVEHKEIVSFYDPMPKRGYVILGDEATKRFMRLLRLVEPLLAGK